MTFKLSCVLVITLSFLVASQASFAQSTQSDSTGAAAVVPRLVAFNGVVARNANVTDAVLGVQFAIYKDQTGGAPLWSEVQNVPVDNLGRYNVLLGAYSEGGLPMDLFASGESRWLGIQPQVPGADEQPRILLVSVPYALKAADAETLGGKPASAYVLSQPDGSAPAPNNSKTENAVKTGSSKEDPTVLNVSGTGTAGTLPKWTDGSGTLADSNVAELNGNIGLGTKTPAYTLHVKGGFLSDIRAEGDSYAKFSWKVNGGGTDQKAWQFFPQTFDNSFVLMSLNDAENAGQNALQIFRGAGTTINSVTFPNGRVGIGTSFPGYTLHVKGGAITDIRAEGDQYAKFSWKVNGGGVDQKTWQFFPQTFDNSFVLGSVNDAENAAQDALKIFRGAGTNINSVTFPNGNVGVGTSTPTAKLDVSGTAKATAFSGDGAAITNVNAASLGGVAAAAYRTRGIVYLAGCDTCSVLTASDNQKTIYMDVIGSMTINSISCFADAGTPTVNIQRDDGTPADVLATDLTCNGTAATNFSGAENQLALNNKLDFVIRNAGASSHRLTVVIQATVN
jgi:hypothetical protein